MIKHCLAFVLLLVIPIGASAQRHGRADAIQTYMRGGPPRPELLLQIRIQGKRLYFRGSDLREMQRTAVTLPDAATRTTYTSEGVNFETLIPNTASRSASEVFEISFGLHQTMTILTSSSPALGKTNLPPEHPSEISVVPTAHISSSFSAEVSAPRQTSGDVS